MSLFVHRELIWILRLTIVFCVLADITNNLTKEPVVINARQIPLLQLKDLDLQMIVPISKFSLLEKCTQLSQLDVHYPKKIQFFFLLLCVLFHEFITKFNHFFFRCNDAKNGQLALCDRNANCFFNKDDLTHSCRCKRGMIFSRVFIISAYQNYIFIIFP